MTYKITKLHLVVLLDELSTKEKLATEKDVIDYINTVGGFNRTISSIATI